jgi:hypothetical protein
MVASVGPSIRLSGTQTTLPRCISWMPSEAFGYPALGLRARDIEEGQEPLPLLTVHAREILAWLVFAVLLTAAGAGAFYLTTWLLARG